MRECHVLVGWMDSTLFIRDVERDLTIHSFPMSTPVRDVANWAAENEINITRWIKHNG